MFRGYDENILSRLSLHVKAFQEGFEILSQAKSLAKLAENFKHIISGSLLITDVNLFYKNSAQSGWETLFVQNKKSIDFLPLLDEYKSYSVRYLVNDHYKIAAYLPLVDGSACGLLFGQKYDGSEFTDADKIALQIFLQLLDNAYQSLMNQKKEKQLIFSLNQKILQLNSLIDTGIEISKLGVESELCTLALERAVSLTNASRGEIKVIESGKNIRVYSFPHKLSEDDYAYSNLKLFTKTSFNKVDYEFILVEKESRTGLVEFDFVDEILLNAIARQVVSAFEHEQNHQRAVENEMIKHELSVAATIQKKIIPDHLPEIPGYDIAGINIPSTEVGGDYYDCIPLEDGRFALIIADVTGKGVPASLLVSTLNASLKAYLDMKLPLSELAIKINKMIYMSSTQDKFITFFISIINPETGEMDIINAGHNPSLILTNENKIREIEAGGVAFGMFDMGLPFENEIITLNPGERLLLYTDGIPEAMDEDENEYTDERLYDFFKNNTPDLASEFIDNIVEDVRKHTKDTVQSDDITALYIVRTK